MKKFVAVLSAAAMMTSLAACGSTADTANTAVSSAETTASAAESTADTAAADSYKVAIVQQLDHASLDEIRVAIEKELGAKAAEKGITIEYKDFNGQNDATTLNQIGTQVVADGYDAIIPIATLAAQCMTTAAESTKTPVIYAAISDPAAADLTDIDYVTGTSDALNTQSIMDMMFAVQPDIQTVGLLYSNSEANSTTPIAEAKAYLDAKGIAYVEKTGNTNDEIMTAASSMVGQVDAVFTPTDNVVMAAAAAADQGDFAFFFVGPDDDGPIIEFAQLLWCRFDQALNHFLFDVVDIIDNFFHDNPFFLDIVKRAYRTCDKLF